VPLPMSLLVAFALGAAFALAAKTELARHDGSLFSSRAAAVVVAFALLVFVPVTAYFAAFHGDWAYLYLVPWQSVPSAVDLALVLASGGLVIAGFAAGAPAARAPSVRSIAILAGAPVGLALVLFAAFARRLMVSGSYAQYHGAFGTEPITSSALGRGVLWGVLAIAVGAAWTVRSLRAPT
jgi:hypothetical protein